jgi:hypothetical protein
MNLIPKLEKAPNGKFVLMFTLTTEAEFIEVLKKDPTMSRFGYTLQCSSKEEALRIKSRMEWIWEVQSKNK